MADTQDSLQLDEVKVGLASTFRDTINLNYSKIETAYGSLSEAVKAVAANMPSNAAVVEVSNTQPSTTGNVLWFDTSSNAGSATEDETYEQTSNKVQTLSSRSTSGTYPSAQCVYSFVNDRTVAVTTSDNGKIMRVVDGKWAAVELPSATGVEF